MSDEEIRHATVLRDMEDELKRQRLGLIDKIEGVLSYFEERRQAEKQRKERLLRYISYFMFIAWAITMVVLVMLSL